MPLHQRGQMLRARAIINYTWDVVLLPDLLDTGPDADQLPASPFGDLERNANRLVIIDREVERLYGPQVSAWLRKWGVTPVMLARDAGEATKTPDTVLSLVSEIHGHRIDRRDPLIAIGGGTLTDTVGLAAALYRRGTPLIRIPTTLVGLVDAGIGAKTGANFCGHKNLVGSYDPAALTLLDLGFLRTLSARRISDGLAEMAKAALVANPELWRLLEQEGPRLLADSLQSDDGWRAVRLSVSAMLAELADNMREKRLERGMDYGHAVGPTLELAAGDMLHGESVALDMAVFTLVAWGRDMITSGTLDRILGGLRGLGLRLWHPILTRDDLLRDALAATTRHRGGKQRLPLVPEVGHVEFVNDVTGDELARAVRELQHIENGAAPDAAP